ncbi:hypothetical protein EIN_371470 [Entamoeba invadens IP1]|uniref:START domain-containing protein n=1 Tax=Entamoeba invadens IP1 TaxID=370355 RepID=A0A0A1UBZ1_ENTIV|nr:hypothetical protein EIN_371470 [Entamoeba invadens IP1]ELP92735.1 hypothetical protein EIN_371470 [Entamoeba invadens IP1]|eukprot:XP_004259506.1 hypothetical protein EIN_371470 [Entamoeba invadens IP1]
MSVDIENLDSCSTKEEVIAKGKKMESWMDEMLADNWTPLSYAHSEIEVSDRPQEGSILYLKSQTTIKADIKKTFEFLKGGSLENQKNIDKDFLSFELIDIYDDNTCALGYFLHKAPWPLSNRDFVFVWKWFIKDGCYYLILESVNSTQHNTYSNDTVRGFITVGMKLVPKDDGFVLIRIVKGDPRGNVPSWLASVVKKNDADCLYHLSSYLPQTFPF